MSELFKIASLAYVVPICVNAMGFFEGSRPIDLLLENASHISTPIVIERLEINGAAYVASPKVAYSGWMNPRGGDTTSGSLPWPEGRDELVLIESTWVDVESGLAFNTSVELPWQDFTVGREVNARLELVVVYGRNGEFRVVTSNGPDPQTGQFNGKELLVTCGARAPDFDKDYVTASVQPSGLARKLAMQDEAIAANPPETSCPEVVG